MRLKRGRLTGLNEAQKWLGLERRLARKLGQIVRTQVGVLHNHLNRLPAAQPLQGQQRGAALGQSACPSVAAVVELEVNQPSVCDCALEHQVIKVRYLVPATGEHKLGVRAPDS